MMGKRKDWLRSLEQLLPLFSGANGELLREQVHKVLLGRHGLLADNAAIGVLIAAGLEVGQAIYTRPGVQASLESALRDMAGGEPEVNLPDAAALPAEEIADWFRVNGPLPNRLAIDGIPGSGKSSLARALAERLDMRWRNLDYENLDLPLPLDADRTIYDHHRLLRTQDIEGFDALIWIDEPVEVSKQRILRRKRGGVLVELLDFDLLKRVGAKAFEIADGEVQSFDQGRIRLKRRPPGGYRAMENLRRELAAQGIDAHGLSKEQCLLLLSERSARGGFLAYLDANAYRQEIMRALVSALYHFGRLKKA